VFLHVKKYRKQFDFWFPAFNCWENSLFIMDWKIWVCLVLKYRGVLLMLWHIHLCIECDVFVVCYKKSLKSTGVEVYIIILWYLLLQLRSQHLETTFFLKFIYYMNNYFSQFSNDF
jgi:hypothetical protein